MKYDIAVGTYHKTGTVWMRKTLRSLTDRLGQKLFRMSRHQIKWKTEADLKALYASHLAGLRAAGDHGFFFDSHSMFPTDMDWSGFRGFRVVRDPRDVVLSAIGYHGRSAEKWLHKPKPEFDGMTYAQMINSIDSFDDKIRFEMDNSAGQVVSQMVAGLDRDFETVRYEDLITDHDMVVWTGLMQRLGLDAAEVEAARQAFWDNSLFGKLAEEGETPQHVSDGGTAQWKRKLTANQIGLIEARFGTEIVRLGYEI
jgi:hypothetical protein